MRLAYTVLLPLVEQIVRRRVAEARVSGRFDSGYWLDFTNLGLSNVDVQGAANWYREV